MENNLNDNIQEWLKLSNRGLFVEAKNYYFNNLFDDIIDRFVDETSGVNSCDVLFSILGFTPEPIILTQRALAPKAHIIFTTNKDYESNNEIISYLEKYLTSNYKIVNLEDGSFETIYDNLKAQMNIYPSTKYVIDITGGKKSMVASAAIFARDYNCNVVYVDYDKYIPELRRPMPGTERLNTVYSVNEDLISLIDFSSISNSSNKADIHPSEQPKKNIPKEKSVNPNKAKESSVKLNCPKFKNSFIDAFLHYVGEETAYSRNWLPKGITLVLKSEKTIFLRTKSLGESITLQRAQLLDFFIRCKRNEAAAKYFIGGTSKRANSLNPAIYGLLNAINYELFGEYFD